jgi:uroporphyrinogen-III decarboxylase
VDIGPLAEGVVFDLPIQRPDDTSPWVRHALTTPAQIEALKVPDPATHPGIQRVYRLYEERKARVEKLRLRVPVGGGLQIHPPLSAACAIVPVDTVYALLYDDPPLIRRLFEKLLETFFRLQDYRDHYFGTKTTSIGLADDNSAFVSDEMYRKFVMPYNMAIYERYGRQGRSLHADGPNDHHFKTYADVMKLTSMDIGGFSDIANARRDLGGKVFFSGGLNCKDLYGTFEEARPAVDRAIRVGAPGGGYALAVGGETYAGVNPDTLVKVVDYVKQAGKYPIK